jgi:phosphate starvation-inducible protein PhoH
MTKHEPLDLSTLSVKEFPLIKKLDRDQEDMVNKLFKSKRVIVDAKAGTGKTTISVQAMQALQNAGHIQTIYYVLFPVQERALGYMPGNMPEKLKEYAVPFFQALIDAGVDSQHLEMERIFNTNLAYDYKIVPHTFLRGRTISNAGIIIDETQNGTVDEIKKTLTRIDDSNYVCVIGHTEQVDIKKSKSGFAQTIHHFKEGKRSGEFTEIEFAKLTINYRGKFSNFADKLTEHFNN